MQILRDWHIAFFTFGSASSHDIQGGILDRKDPDFMRKAKQAIAKGLPCRICRESWWPDVLTDYLEKLEEKVHYKHWYFGPYHLDKNMDSKHTLLYHAILSLGDTDTDLSKVPRPGYLMYRLGEKVTFKWRGGEETGKITGVDGFGTFEQGEEPSYDIYREGICLYKHISESEIIVRKG